MVKSGERTDKKQTRQGIVSDVRAASKTFQVKLVNCYTEGFFLIKETSSVKPPRTALPFRFL